MKIKVGDTGSIREVVTMIISATKKLQVIYTMAGTTGLFQKVIDLPDVIETSGIDFNSDPAFRAQIEAAFRGQIVAEADAAYKSLDTRETWPLRANGTEADGHIIVAVFGLGARPKALIG
jgi:NAD(P)-dependent dehydrogenase (short-subunit alcohol dehydrogenase family)